MPTRASGQASRAKPKVKIRVKPETRIVGLGLHLPRSARHTTAQAGAQSPRNSREKRTETPAGLRS